LPQALIDPLLEAPAKAFADDQNWQGHLTALGITGAHHQQCATEGALWGAIVEQRLLEGVVVVSDGAPAICHRRPCPVLDPCRETSPS